MRIELVKQNEVNDLRLSQSNSSFLNEDFDEFILGVHEETGSIVYNLYGIVNALIVEEYPDLEFDDDSDEWCDAYYDILDRLSFSDVYYELESLIENTLDIQKNGGAVLSTLTGNLDIINYQGDKRVLDILPDQDS